MKLKTVVTSIALVLSASSASYADNDLDDKKHGSKGFSFALIGDTPYGVEAGERDIPFDNLVEDINDDKKLSWVLHAGDIKSGSSECSDELFYDRHQRYSQFKYPVILTLGDNEWTDCHRVKAGAYEPLERLSRLREVFFSEPGITLAKPMHVNTQAFDAGYEEFPENVMWKKSNVIFASMHIVGSDNGLKAFDPAGGVIRTEADDLEVERRTNAAIAWMNKAFDKAEDSNSKGVFLMIHANPDLEFKWLLDRDENGVVKRPGFTQFLMNLSNRTKAFGKPVILAHGDSHWFRIDKPELPISIDTPDSFFSNFTRVETFGSKIVHWVKVTVDPASNEVFQFSQKLVKDNM